MNESQFREQAKADGYGEVKPLVFEPNMAKEMHTHDFSAFLLVLEGELELRREDGTQRFGVGECCKLAAGTPHEEHTGPNGARALIARL